MNCKPGDLAIVIRGLNPNSIHAGKIVRVIDLAFPNHPKLGPIWNIELSRAISIKSFKRDLTPLNKEEMLTRCHSPDDWLRPLPGDTIDDEVIDEVSAPTNQLEPA